MSHHNDRPPAHPDGITLAWGRGRHGVLGTGEPSDENAETTLGSPRTVGGALSGRRLSQLCCGELHTLALTADAGAVFSWGSGLMGALGHGGRGNEAMPRRVEGIPFATQLAAGKHHSAALCPDAGGAVYAWGWDGWEGSTCVKAPVRLSHLPAGSGRQIAAGAFHLAVLTRADGVVSSGGGVVQAGVLRDAGIVQIAAGTRHTAALASDAYVYTWTHGAISSADYPTPHRNTPSRLEPSANAPLRCAWLGGALRICCGGEYTFAVLPTADGSRLVRWQLLSAPDGATPLSAPLDDRDAGEMAVPGAERLVAGGGYAIVLLNDGGAICLSPHGKPLDSSNLSGSAGGGGGAGGFGGLPIGLAPSLATPGERLVLPTGGFSRLACFAISDFHAVASVEHGHGGGLGQIEPLAIRANVREVAEAAGRASLSAPDASMGTAGAFVSAPPPTPHRSPYATAAYPPLPPMDAPPREPNTPQDHDRCSLHAGLSSYPAYTPGPTGGHHAAAHHAFAPAPPPPAHASAMSDDPYRPPYDLQLPPSRQPSNSKAHSPTALGVSFDQSLAPPPPAPPPPIRPPSFGAPTEAEEAPGLHLAEPPPPAYSSELRACDGRPSHSTASNGVDEYAESIHQAAVASRFAASTRASTTASGHASPGGGLLQRTQGHGVHGNGGSSTPHSSAKSPTEAAWLRELSRLEGGLGGGRFDFPPVNAALGDGGGSAPPPPQPAHPPPQPALPLSPRSLQVSKLEEQLRLLKEQQPSSAPPPPAAPAPPMPQHARAAIGAPSQSLVEELAIHVGAQLRAELVSEVKRDLANELRTQVQQMQASLVALLQPASKHQMAAASSSGRPGSSPAGAGAGGGARSPRQGMREAARDGKSTPAPQGRSPSASGRSTDGRSPSRDARAPTSTPTSRSSKGGSPSPRALGASSVTSASRTPNATRSARVLESGGRAAEASSSGHDAAADVADGIGRYNEHAHEVASELREATRLTDEFLELERLAEVGGCSPPDVEEGWGDTASSRGGGGASRGQCVNADETQRPSVHTPSAAGRRAATPGSQPTPPRGPPAGITPSKAPPSAGRPPRRSCGGSLCALLNTGSPSTSAAGASARTAEGGACAAEEYLALPDAPSRGLSRGAVVKRGGGRVEVHATMPTSRLAAAKVRTSVASANTNADNRRGQVRSTVDGCSSPKYHGSASGGGPPAKASPQEGSWAWTRAHADETAFVGHASNATTLSSYHGGGATTNVQDDVMGGPVCWASGPNTNASMAAVSALASARRHAQPTPTAHDGGEEPTPSERIRLENAARAERRRPNREWDPSPAGVPTGGLKYDKPSPRGDAHAHTRSSVTSRVGAAAAHGRPRVENAGRHAAAVGGSTPARGMAQPAPSRLPTPSDGKRQVRQLGPRPRKDTFSAA